MKLFNPRIRLAAYTISLLLFLTACSRDTPEDTTPEDLSEVTQTPWQMPPEADQQLWSAGAKAVDEFADRSRELVTAIAALLEYPTEAALDEARNRWLDLRAAEAGFAFFGNFGEVAPDVFPKLDALNFALTAYPIQPGYLDAFGPYQYSGIVFDIGVALTRENLREQNAMTDREDILLGIHAIEFMVFGLDHQRPVSDFKPALALDDTLREQGFHSLEELPNNRRRQLLHLQAQQLLNDVASLRNAWPERAISLAEESLQSRWRNLPGVNKVTIGKRALRETLSTSIIFTAKVIHNLTVASDTEDQPASETEINFSVKPHIAPEFLTSYYNALLNSLRVGNVLFEVNAREAYQTPLGLMEASVEKITNLPEETSLIDVVKEIHGHLEQARLINQN